MARRPCSYKQTDLTRALRAAKAAGVPVKIEFQDGKMTVTSMDKAGTIDSERNEWDAEYGPDQAKVRKRLRKP